MLKDWEKFHQQRLQTACDALQKIMQIEGELRRGRDNLSRIERAQIVHPAVSLFDLLSIDIRYTIEAIATDLFPPAPVADEINFDNLDTSQTDLEDQVSTEIWRDSAAFLIQHHIPLPRLMADDLSAALSALNSGEVKSLVAPTKTGKRKRAWTISRLQLAAYAHVYFLSGQGFRVEQARETVAREYGYHENGANTVRSWANRELKNEFGPEYLERIKKLSERAGKLSKPSNPDQSVNPEDTDAHWFLTELEILPLAHCGDLYNRALQGEQVQITGWVLHA